MFHYYHTYHDNTYTDRVKKYTEIIINCEFGVVKIDDDSTRDKALLINIVDKRGSKVDFIVVYEFPTDPVHIALVLRDIEDSNMTYSKDDIINYFKSKVKSKG